MRPAFNRDIVDKGQLGHGAQIHPLCQLATHKPRGALQGLGRQGGVALQQGKKDLRVLKIPRHAHGGETHPHRTRIAQFPGTDNRQFMANLLFNAS